MTAVEFHAWCVDSAGLVHNYSTDKLKILSTHGTNDIICHPFDIELVMKFLLFIEGNTRNLCMIINDWLMIIF